MTIHHDEHDSSSTPIRLWRGAGTRYFSNPGWWSNGRLKTSISRLTCTTPNRDYHKSLLNCIGWQVEPVSENINFSLTPPKLIPKRRNSDVVWLEVRKKTVTWLLSCVLVTAANKLAGSSRTGEVTPTLSSNQSLSRIIALNAHLKAYYSYLIIFCNKWCIANHLRSRQGCQSAEPTSAKSPSSASAMASCITWLRGMKAGFAAFCTPKQYTCQILSTIPSSRPLLGSGFFVSRKQDHHFVW